jgi:hypothetical protein
MINPAVFMGRLRRIIAEAPADEVTSLAANMFRSYKQSLYSEFDIRSANRLTRAVKTRASDVLADLRLEIMHMEFAVPEQSAARAACSAVRWEIDMARRALALRHEVPECDKPDGNPPMECLGGSAEEDCGHQAMLQACRREFQGAIGMVVSFPNSGLHPRRTLQSMELLSRSRALLARLRRSQVR